MNRPNVAPEIKRSLTDARRVCDALGLTAGGPRTWTKQAAGVIVRCPVHEDRSPSCSVQLRGGALLWKCHGCGAGGDVLSLVAAVRGLSLKRDFRGVLVEAARLGGLWQIVDEFEGRGAATVERPPPAPPPPTEKPEPERAWPPVVEVCALWKACGPLEPDEEVSAYLRGRTLDPSRLDALELMRVLPESGALPRWARYRGRSAEARSWRELGYRLIVPMFDEAGEMRSVRAWRVRDGEGPKRLPPSGCKASGLVMADDFGRAMLAGARKPVTIAIVEGEPDFAARCMVTHDPGVAVLGIVSGSWTPGFASRVPVGASVPVRTDNDAAGDRYAAEIIATLKRRCFPYRTRREA